MKKYYLFLVLLLLISHVVGCKADDEEISKEQLIEIREMDTGSVLRQITDTATIKEYTEKSKPEKWVEINFVPKDSEELYAFTSYAKISDKAYLKDGKTWISAYQVILYYNSNGFYIKEIALNDSNIPIDTFQIPDSAGEYLISLPDGNWEIKDKNNIFALWEVDYSSLDDIVNDREKYDSEEADENDNQVYDVDGVKQASKKQKIEKIDINGSILCSITDLEEITEFYNTLSENGWTELGKLPDDSKEICSIIFYQNERKAIIKDMLETHRIILYKKDNQYYVSNIILGNAENKDMVIYSEIPFDVGKYIEDWQ